jgi:hypothetical protein
MDPPGAYVPGGRRRESRQSSSGRSTGNADLLEQLRHVIALHNGRATTRGGGELL